MKTIHTHTYTNAILTVIAILLAVLAFQTFFDFSSSAQAQRDRNFDSPREFGEDSYTMERRGMEAPAGDNMQADAQREIASAIQSLAEAVQNVGDAGRDSAEAQRDIADAIRSLGNL